MQSQQQSSLDAWNAQQRQAYDQCWSLLAEWRSTWFDIQPAIMPMSLIEQGYYILGVLAPLVKMDVDAIFDSTLDISKEAFMRGVHDSPNPSPSNVIPFNLH